MIARLIKWWKAGAPYRGWKRGHGSAYYASKIINGHQFSVAYCRDDDSWLVMGMDRYVERPSWQRAVETAHEMAALDVPKGRARPWSGEGR